MNDCAVRYFERGFTIMAVPASYTPYAVFFLRTTPTLPQCGQYLWPAHLMRSKCSIHVSWSGKRSMTAMRFIRKCSCILTVAFSDNPAILTVELLKTRKSNLVFSKGEFPLPFLTTYIIAYLRNINQAKTLYLSGFMALFQLFLQSQNY